MNKPHRLILLFLAAFLLSACSEKKQYEEAVLAEMQSEPDIKDYKLDPAVMAKCVVDTSSSKMPGIFAGDPERMKAYLTYTKMLTMKKAKDPQKVMDELRAEFGSAKGLLEARSNYTDSLVNCQTSLITSAEPAEAAPDGVVTPVVVPAPAVAPEPVIAPAK